jgi:quinol monooxygenase YgiN
MTDPGLLLVAELHGLAGREAELRALLAELAQSARAEPGCVGFRVLASDDPGEVVLLAGWRDEPALRGHYGTPGYRRYREQVGPLLARPSEVVVHHVAGTLHARDPNPPEPGMLG